MFIETLLSFAPAVVTWWRAVSSLSDGADDDGADGGVVPVTLPALAPTSTPAMAYVASPAPTAAIASPALPEVIAGFPAFTSKFEGVVRGPYLDVKGFVTTGIGNLIDPVGLSLPLPWLHEDGTPATQDEIRADWERVKLMPAAMVASRYAGPLHLDDAGIAAVVNKTLLANAAQLARTFPDFSTYPAPAQTALLSMAWALGAGFPAKWPNFSAAVRARDWQTAAANSSINAVGNAGVTPRNAADHDLFLQAAALDSGYTTDKTAAGCGLNKYSVSPAVGGMRSGVDMGGLQPDWGSIKTAGGVGGAFDQRRGDPRSTGPDYAGVPPDLFTSGPMSPSDPLLGDGTYLYDEIGQAQQAQAWATVPQYAWMIMAPSPYPYNAFELPFQVLDGAPGTPGAAQGWTEVCAEPDVPMSDQPNLTCLAGAQHTSSGPGISYGETVSPADYAAGRRASGAPVDDATKAIVQKGIRASVEDGTADPPVWIQIHVGPYLICTTAEPLTVGGLRLPTSMEDAVAVGHRLGAVLLTPKVSEARWNTPGVRQVTSKPLGDSTGALLNDPSQVARYNAAIGPNTGTLSDGFQKELVLVPGLQRSGKGAMAQYGFRNTGAPDHVMFEHGGPSNHDRHWKDYSDTPNYMGLTALRQNADGTTTQVNLLDVLAAGDPDLGGPLPDWLIQELRGGDVGA